MSSSDHVHDTYEGSFSLWQLRPIIWSWSSFFLSSFHSVAIDRRVVYLTSLLYLVHRENQDYMKKRIGWIVLGLIGVTNNSNNLLYYVILSSSADHDP